MQCSNHVFSFNATLEIQQIKRAQYIETQMQVETGLGK